MWGGRTGLQGEGLGCAVNTWGPVRVRLMRWLLTEEGAGLGEQWTAFEVLGESHMGFSSERCWLKGDLQSRL